jgi:hypothetical protein
MSSVNTLWGVDFILPANHFYPHAPRVVDMASDHPDSAICRAWNLLTPQFGWKILKKEFCNPVAGLPGREQVILWVNAFHGKKFEVLFDHAFFNL